MRLGEWGARARRLFALAIRREEDARTDGRAELESVLDEQVRHLVAGGADEATARQEALARLGVSLAEAHRMVANSAGGRERRLTRLERLADWWLDLKQAGRSVLRSPATAVTAAMTLALAVAANTAVFAVVDTVLLRPLPVRDPERLVALWETNPDFGWERAEAAPANMLDWREQVSAFVDIAAYPSFGGEVTLTGFGPPRLLNSRRATGNFFTVLGVEPLLGRLFNESETWDGGEPPSVVLSATTWRDVFGSDPGVVGRPIQLDGRDVVVSGVLPPNFAIPGAKVDIWRPTQWNRSDREQIWFRRAHWLRPVARLKPGVSLDEARAGLAVVVARLSRDYPATNATMGAGLGPWHDYLVGSTRVPLLVLLVSAATLLVIAGGNIANLLLVRAVGQQRESAVRLALGAGRGRLVRRGLLEAGVIAVVGGAAGIALGRWGGGVLFAFRPEGMVPVEALAFRWSAVGYSFGIVAMALLGFGLGPGLLAAGRSPLEAFAGSTRVGGLGRGARRWVSGLLVGQVALTVTLLLAAGLLARTYQKLGEVDPGFDPTGVLTTRIDLPRVRYDTREATQAFFDELERRAASLPGVRAAALVSATPLGPPPWSSDFAIEGQPPRPNGAQVIHREQTSGYQGLMGVRLVAGRLFTDSDRRGAPLVVLINETLARRHFGGLDPIGQRITFDRVPDSTSVWRTIVGVVADERQGGLGREPDPEFFAPHSQEGRSSLVLMVRAIGAATPLAAPIRQLLADLDPNLAVPPSVTMDSIVAQSLARERFLMLLLLTFAGIGLVLSIVGVYGTGSELVRRRVRELGIRLAVGARPRAVRWLVVRQGLALAGLGVGIGVILALAAAGVLGKLLYGIAPTDPATFVAVSGLMLATAGLASWMPARRASRLDPGLVLRGD